MANKDYTSPDYNFGLEGPGPFFMPAIHEVEGLYVGPGEIVKWENLRKGKSFG